MAADLLGVIILTLCITYTLTSADASRIHDERTDEVTVTGTLMTRKGSCPPAGASCMSGKDCCDGMSCALGKCTAPLNVTTLLVANSGCKECLDPLCGLMSDARRLCNTCSNPDVASECLVGCYAMMANTTCKSKCPSASRGSFGTQCKMCRDFQLNNKTNDEYKSSYTSCSDDFVDADFEMPPEQMKQFATVKKYLLPGTAQMQCGLITNPEDGKKCSLIGDPTSKMNPLPAPLSQDKVEMNLNKTADCKSCLEMFCNSANETAYCNACSPNATVKATCRRGCLAFASLSDCKDKCPADAAGTRGAACSQCDSVPFLDCFANVAHTCTTALVSLCEANDAKTPKVKDPRCDGPKRSQEAQKNQINLYSVYSYGCVRAQPACYKITNYEDGKPCVPFGNIVSFNQ